MGTQRRLLGRRHRRSSDGVVVDPVTGAVLAAEQDNYVSYDDDFVFLVGNTADVWVSRYQIVYFFAALNFVFVGLIDLYVERCLFHVCMILAGTFGLISAVFVEESMRASNVLNLISVHLFLLEGFALFGQHKRAPVSAGSGTGLKRVVLLGDAQFILGAFFDVILSYFYVFDDTHEWDTSLMITTVFAAVLWLNCALIYLGSLLYDRMIKSAPVKNP
ncbi:hypothetical protein ACHAWF_002604 [Thalassiosira exigua]